MKWRGLVLVGFLALFTLCLLSSPAYGLFGDVDGDGYTDEVYLDGFSVVVFHPQTGQTSTYNYPNTVYLSLDGVADTDADPGDEIIVSAVESYTSIDRVEVIHDKYKTKNSYDFGVVTGLSINSISDHDGIPGAEICVYWWTASTSEYNLIVDRTKSILLGCTITLPPDTTPPLRFNHNQWWKQHHIFYFGYPYSVSVRSQWCLSDVYQQYHLLFSLGEVFNLKILDTYSGRWYKGSLCLVYGQRGQH